MHALRENNLIKASIGVAIVLVLLSIGFTKPEPLPTAQAKEANVVWYLGGASTTTFYVENGTYDWEVPTGVTEAQVMCWGAGGAGGCCRSGYGQGGGGGGAFASGTIPVTAGNTYRIIGGVATLDTGITSSSSFNNTALYAYGGERGTVGATGANNAGGAGGSTASGTVTYAGGTGGNGTGVGDTSGGGGGSAGPDGIGGTGGNANGTIGGAGGVGDNTLGGTSGTAGNGGAGGIGGDSQLGGGGGGGGDNAGNGGAGGNYGGGAGGTENSVNTYGGYGACKITYTQITADATVIYQSEFFFE